MGPIEISYRFTLADGTHETFDLKLDASNLELIDNVPDELPAWSELAFRQCARVLSHEWITNEVTTAERTYVQEVPAQRGISSLMGLIIATSGCPLTTFFRPMARFHVPWASQEETTYRATSMYLLAQYLRKRDGKSADLELDGLAAIYEGVRGVNRAFIERLRAATEEDSAINAIVVLDTQALSIPWSIDSALEELRPGFEQYL
jgi:hypothetical protein